MNADFLHFVTSKQIQPSLDFFGQELANHSPWSKSGPPPVSVINKVLFAHSYTHLFAYYLRLLCAPMTESSSYDRDRLCTPWPPLQERFTDSCCR